MGEMVGSKNYAGYLLPSALTIAEALKLAGYNSYMSGKWHVGEDSLHWPLQRGFDRYYGLISGASSYYELDPGRTMLENNTRIKPGGDFYATRAYTQKALQYIKEGHAQQKPYLLYLAYTAPHWPLHAPDADVQPYIGKYRMGWEELRKQRYQKQLQEGILTPEVKLSPLDPEVTAWSQVPDQGKWDRRMAVYAAMISIMDEGIGQIIQTLKAQGELDNTVIFFLSDNGGCAEIPHVYKTKLKTMSEAQLTANVGDHISYVGYEDRWAAASNTPFRRYKQFTHEGGIASPLIVHWPAKIKKPGLVPDMVHIMDLMPTALEIVGRAYPKTYRGQALLPLDGKSFYPLLENKKWAGHEVLVWEHFGSKAIRQGNWKLVAAQNSPWELYDLKADRSETNNLAAQRPDKVKELGRLYLQKAVAAGVKNP
jgi:arylsulfatase